MIALIAILRRDLGLDARLDPWDEKVRRNFQDWAFRQQAGALKFTEEQMDWLRMIRDHIAASVSISEDDLDFAPFDAKGGRGKMWQLFGDQAEAVLRELNEDVAA